jgi:hypothetical protein
MAAGAFFVFRGADLKRRAAYLTADLTGAMFGGSALV